jgi:hypothetical protein
MLQQDAVWHQRAPSAKLMQLMQDAPRQLKRQKASDGKEQRSEQHDSPVGAWTFCVHVPPHPLCITAQANIRKHHYSHWKRPQTSAVA